MEQLPLGIIFNNYIERLYTMKQLKWNTDYLTGELMVDNEHKYLFEIAQEAFAVVDPSVRAEKIKHTVQKLYKYTKEHFAHEEQFMTLHAFPKSKQHAILHDKIIGSLNELLQKLPQMKIVEFEREMAHFIDVGLVKHFLSQDTQLHEWIEKRKKYRESSAWRESYTVGNGLIDAQHKELFNLLEEMFKEAEPAVRKENISSNMNRFLGLMEIHFKQENEYMQKIKYPQIKKCVENNNKILSEINHFISKLPMLELFAFEMSLTKFVDKWLVEHIEKNKAMVLWKEEQDEEV